MKGFFQVTILGLYLVIFSTSCGGGNSSDLSSPSILGKWGETFGKGYVNDVKQISDGGYIAAGSAEIEGEHQVWVFKVDGTGNLLWQKTYNIGAFDSANAIQQTSDGGYILAGFTQSDALVLKLDSNGNTYLDGLGLQALNAIATGRISLTDSEFSYIALSDKNYATLRTSAYMPIERRENFSTNFVMVYQQLITVSRSQQCG